MAQKNYLNVFFCVFDMILLWFCYGFDMVENMVFLWSETTSWRRYEFRYGFVMVWTCLQPSYFDRTFQDMYLYYWHIFELLLNLLIKQYRFKNEKMKKKIPYIFVYYWKMHISIKERLSINWKIRKGIKIILLILLYLWGQEKL